MTTPSYPTLAGKVALITGKVEFVVSFALQYDDNVIHVLEVLDSRVISVM